MIDFQNVSFSYGEESHGGGIRNINLTIKTGEFVLLTGESGCGKTTITRLVNGLVPHYYEGNLEGDVFLDGKSVSDTPLYDLAAMVGSVFQNPKSQFFNVDTDSELAFACENLGYPQEDILQRMDRTISDYHIEDLMGRSVFALSGGEKQKIACASSSVLLPGIMVLDEPSSNLDMSAIDDLRQVLSLWKKQGKTILIAEHRLYYTSHQLFTESVTDEVLLSMDDEDETIVNKILKQFDLLEYKDRHPLSLSGGQKQRVAIASAIVSNREIIVFDEPTSGLDLKHMREVARGLKSLADQGKTLLVITHDPELVMAGCSYVVHMEKGQIKESYPLDESGSKKVLDFFRIRQ